MKKLYSLKFTLSVLLILFISGCFIYEIEQPASVNTGSTFTTTVRVEDINAEQANPHKGVVCVMVPADWSFTDGTYTSTVGTGSLELNPDNPIVYGDIDTLIAPPTGMKWIQLLTDNGYLHDANVFYDATVNFQVGTATGDFPIGYLVTVNSGNMFQFLNDQDQDQELSGTDTSMNHMVTVSGATGVSDDNQLVSSYKLHQNYPNPFNPSTKIKFSLPKASDVKITVYNTIGKEIARLTDGLYTSGTHEVNFDASNLVSGVYLYKIQTSNFSEIKKMILLK